MNSIIVEVYIPAIDSTSDFLVPRTGIAQDMALQMAQALESIKRNVLFSGEQLLLCDLQRGTVLTPEKTLAENGITDGTRLMLL